MLNRILANVASMTFDDMDGHMAAGFMSNMFAFVDQQLKTLNDIIAQDMSESGDSGLFDDAEYFTGIGFLAGQRYIACVCGTLRVSKKEALSLGPKRHNGIAYAALVNAVANYWKHSDEWDFEKLSDQQQRTRSEIESIGITVSDGYVISNVFHALDLKSFSNLAPLLREWSNAVMEWKERTFG